MRMPDEPRGRPGLTSVVTLAGVDVPAVVVVLKTEQDAAVREVFGPGIAEVGLHRVIRIGDGDGIHHLEGGVVPGDTDIAPVDVRGGGKRRREHHRCKK